MKNLHGTTPRECVKDAKSAIRYARENADALGIDPDRIAAGGGSAGGHVAAAAGTLSAYDEAGENLAISSKPDALVLYNPVVDNGPGGYGHSKVEAYWEDFSPLHNIDATAPPTVFFLGTRDHLIPVSVGTGYQSAMEAAGLRCDLHLYEGQGHGFFNFDVPDDGSGPFHGYQDTIFKTDEFLVSLGYLPDPHDDPAPVSGWATLSGDAGFAASSAATSSPATTDADGDAIAANFDPVTLADGRFIRLTGTVTVNTPLAGNQFRIGLFDGDNPATAGDGSGYSGIWAGAPDTSSAVIAASDGSGSGHPFDPATTLGPVPAATTVPANTPVGFSLFIARNGKRLDIATSFADAGSYRPAQNLLNVAVSKFAFNSVALLLGEGLDATAANFSDIAVATGPALPSAELPPGGNSGSSGAITYVDAVEGADGNTFVTGLAPGDTSWVGPDSSATNNLQWNKRSGVEGNGGSLFQGSISKDILPELTTRITGLSDGTYAIWAFYWDQVVSDSQNWILSAGLTSGALTSYSSPGEPPVAGATTAGVTNAAQLDFTETAPAVVSSDSLRNLFGIRLGEVTVSEGSAVKVFLDNSNTAGSSNRAWYDGVGYQPIVPGTTTTYTPVLGIDFNRDDALGSPSQSGFRVISGSAADQAANAASYFKTFGPRQVTVSRPDGSNFEFRGANTDSTRAIPGGDISMSYLVSDFIATRGGAIDISITGLTAGNYRFRSRHLDTFAGSGLGFAQGSGATTPNTIECRIGGLTRDTVRPTALGSAGLDTTYVNDSRIPSLDFTFTHDGGSPLTLKLRALESNGTDNFLLLNGFQLLQETP